LAIASRKSRQVILNHVATAAALGPVDLLHRQAYGFGRHSSGGNGATEIMARTASKLKLGYYPLVEQEAKRIRRFLQFAGATSVLDPCAGTGSALRTITDGVEARRYGIELDAHRAAEAKKVLDEVIQGSVFETHSPVESYGLLYLNAPYDHEIGEGKNQRLEQVFLEHTFRWLKPGAVLVMIVPFERVIDCKGVLTPHATVVIPRPAVQ